MKCASLRVGDTVSWFTNGRGARYPRKGVITDVRYNRLGKMKVCVECEQPDGSFKIYYPLVGSLTKSVK